MRIPLKTHQDNAKEIIRHGNLIPIEQNQRLTIRHGEPLQRQ